MSIKARRKGSTAKMWSYDPSKVSLRAFTAKTGTPRIVFSFWMPSKGGGYTDVELVIDDDRFEPVVKGMVVANDARTLLVIGTILSASPDATIKACGAILIAQAGPPDSTTRIEAAPLAAGFQTSATVN